MTQEGNQDGLVGDMYRIRRRRCTVHSAVVHPTIRSDVAMTLPMAISFQASSFGGAHLELRKNRHLQ